MSARSIQTAWTNSFLSTYKWPRLTLSLTVDVYLATVIFLIAAGLRFWDLDFLPIHHDEGIHIRLSYDLANGGSYIHSPAYHGPLQYYLNGLVFLTFWDSDYTARLVYAFFGTMLTMLPFFIRSYLGRAGCFITALLLAISPTLLYFSRFARNDIIMAVWTLGLVICFWRYIQSGQHRYLYLLSCILAFAFLTKETAYLVIAIFGIIFFLLTITDIVPWVWGRIRISEVSPGASLWILLATLSLPLWSALIAFPQDRLGITLVTTAGSDIPVALVGLPDGLGAWIVAISALAATAMLAVLIGIMWKWRVWLFCALIFWTIWAVFYSSLFTNLGGLFTGSWQGLGYWLAQQEVARGGQPWYYYIMLLLNYEFLPILFGLPAILLYLWRGDAFSIFLVLWAILTLIAYTLAGEKMPWLTVNIVLPFIVLSGKFIGEMLSSIPWRRTLRRGEITLIASAPLTAISTLYLLRNQLGSQSLSAWQGWIYLAAFSFILLAASIVFMRTVKLRHAVFLAATGMFALMLGFGTLVSIRASYGIIDETHEMLVYAGIGHGVIQTRDRIISLGNETQTNLEMRVTIDEFTWPWWWYLRRHTNITYTCFKSGSPNCRSMSDISNDPLILLNAANSSSASNYLSNHEQGKPYNHLLWFPQTYQNLEDKIFTAIHTKESWRLLLDYFIERKLQTPWENTKVTPYTRKNLKPSGPEPNT